MKEKNPEFPKFTFHSSIPERQRVEFIESAIRSTKREALASPIEDDSEQEIFVKSKEAIIKHFVSYGVDKELISQRVKALPPIASGSLTAYAPTLHKILINDQELENIGFGTPTLREHALRHEVSHSGSRNGIFFGSRMPIMRSGLSLNRIGAEQYGFTLNELLIDTIATRSGAEKDEKTIGREKIIATIEKNIAKMSTGLKTEDEVYRAFLHVICKGWGAKPYGKQLKQAIRETYGSFGLSLIMRIKWPTPEKPTEEKIFSELNADPIIKFLLNPPESSKEKEGFGFQLLGKKTGPKS